MIKSAGVLIQSQTKILLCHATDTNAITSGKESNSHSQYRWGIPKGKIDGGENPKETALRETLEETGLDLLKLGFEISDSPIEILRYLTVGEKKTVYVYYLYDEFGFLQTKNLSCSTLIPDTKFPENDDFKWVTKEEARSLIYRSQLRLLNYIK